MAYASPLRNLQEQAEAEFLRYGHGDDETSVDLVATYGEVEAEYASIRKACGLMELPHRGFVHVTGTERADFLNRLLTNELASTAPGHVTRAFWLNRKGRIQADLLAIDRGDEDGFLLSMDLINVASAVAGFNDLIFTEDVEVRDATDDWHLLTLHGPAAIETLRRACDGSATDQLADVQMLRAFNCTVASTEIVAFRYDVAGDAGLHLVCPANAVVAVHERLLETGLPSGMRSIGWHAFNMARLEGGTPIYNIDFGPDSLPHETGVLHDAVSFTKGCYPGQEVVARMENLGKPSKKLVGLKIEGDFLPVTGAQVFEPEKITGDVVGAVTSAAPSPMLGHTMIAFAMVKSSLAKDGTALAVVAEGQPATATVHPLQFWTSAEKK